MQTLEFVEDQLNGHQIFRLEGGTKYLPSLYIKHNAHWDRWMVFESKTSTAITNRIFTSKKDCIDYIEQYDTNSEKTLDVFYQEIENKSLIETIQKINFKEPKLIDHFDMNGELDLLFSAQKVEISKHYDVATDNLKLICWFFDGLLSLYVDQHDNSTNNFYIMNNGSISDYPSWKTVSVAIALFKTVISYDQEKSRQKILQMRLDFLVGKAVIADNGYGFAFGNHIKNTNLMYVQRVGVDTVDDKKVADATQPLTPMFLCELKIDRVQILIEIKSNHNNISIHNDFFVLTDVHT